MDGDHFYVDLVLFHTELSCHVVVELKCGKFEPRDLGQLQFYVNYFDTERRQPHQNPTFGLLLCADKNVKYIRQLYLVYPDLINAGEIGHAVRGEFRPGDLATGCLNPNLSWTHYRTLLRVKDVAERAFYESEAAKRCWSARALERQITRFCTREPQGLTTRKR